MGSKPRDDLRVTPPPRFDRPASGGRGRVTDLDVEKLQNSLEKITSTINKSARHTERIPEIQRKVEATSDKVIELDTKMAVTTERVAGIEKKVDRGHDCFQIDVISEIKDSHREASQKIETDIQKGIEHRAKLAAVIKDQSQTEADVADIKKAPRRMFYGLLGVIMTLAAGGLSAAWFLAQLERNVIHEQEQRVEQFNRIESQIKTVGTKSNTAPVTKALENLEDEIETSNGHEEAYNSICDEMPRHEKRLMKNTFQRRGKRVPVSCM